MNNSIQVRGEEEDNIIFENIAVVKRQWETKLSLVFD